MNILFITATRLGDAVLSTGLLDYMQTRWPEGKVSVACGWLPAPIFEGFPNVEYVIPMKKQAFRGHWIDLWKHVRGRQWDTIVDLRNSAVSRLVRAKARYVFGPHIDESRHKVEQAAAVMGLKDVPAPKLYFTKTQERDAKLLVPDGGRVLGIGPTANWIGKTWPAERFIELIGALTGSGGAFEGWRVAVFAAPGEEAQAKKVLESVQWDKRIDMIARGDPGVAAAALARCDFYIGNDSGLMHCAAAAGTPTVGLFGPSWPHLYRPWGDHTAYVSTPENFDELTNFPGYDPKTLDRTLMTSLSAAAVLKAVKDHWLRVS